VPPPSEDAPAIAAARQHLIETGEMTADTPFTTAVREEGGAWYVTFRIADDFGRRVAVIGTEVTRIAGEAGALYVVEVIEANRDEPGVVEDDG
jgi:hypothetical protein